MPKGYPGSKAPHGTRARYAHGCRCDDCRDAGTAYARERNGQMPRASYLRSILPPHGTESRYRRGCRCKFCREAARVGRSGRRARAKA